MTPIRQRARKGEGDLLREEILAVTEALLVETGSEDAVSIRSVARAAGITPPSIYRHFVDKNDLMFEVCNRVFARLDASLEAAMEGIDDPVDALRERGRAYVRFGLEHPEQYRIMFMGASWAKPDRWDEILETGSFAHLVGGIQQVIDAGRMDPGTDPYRMALHVWANIHGITSLLVARPSLPWPELSEFIDEHLTICMQGALRDPVTTGSARARR